MTAICSGDPLLGCPIQQADRGSRRVGLLEVAFLGRDTVPGAAELFGRKHFPVLSRFPRQPREQREEGVVAGFFCSPPLMRTKASLLAVAGPGATERMRKWSRERRPGRAEN